MQAIFAKVKPPAGWERWLGWFCLAAFLLPLLLYSYIGFFTRYVADDYETAGAVQRYGVLGAQQYWYLSWSGRYAYFFIISVFEAVGGIKAVPYLTLVCLGLWMVGLTWVIKQLLELPVSGVIVNRRSGSLFLAVLGAAVVLTVTLRGLQHINQILFWQTGLMTYVFYLLLFTLGAGILLRRLLRQDPGQATMWEVLAWGASAFVLAGLSELSATLQLTAMFSGLSCFWICRSSRQRPAGLPIFAAMALATLIGLIVMYLAPGNDVRALKFPDRPGIMDLLVNSLYYTVNFVGRWLANQGVLALTATLFPLIAALAYPFEDQPPQPREHQQESGVRLACWLLGSAGILFLLLWSGNFTGYYTTTDEPPARSLVLPQYFLTLFLVTWSFITGRVLARTLTRHAQNDAVEDTHAAVFLRLVGLLVVLTLLFYGPLYDSTRIYSLIAPARERALEWDERDGLIREAAAQGETSVTVWYIYDPNGLGDYSVDPDFLVNRAAADYYGLESLIALDKKP